MSAARRVVFFGSGEFGVPTLARLAAVHELLAAVTQPDRPAGRSRKPTPTPVAQWIAEHRPWLTVLKPENVNEPGMMDRIRSMPADAFVVIAFGQKLGSALLAERFAVNLHASLLPRWRGAAPINHAILAGDAETGNSVITVASKMDAGEILAQSRRTIDPAMTTGELHDVLAEDGPGLVLDVLSRHAAGTLSPRAQDPSRVTLAPKLSKEDGWIDFAESAEAVRRRVHGLTPWPGVAVTIRGEPMKVLRVEELPAGDVAQSPGTLVDAERGIVACGGGTSVRLIDVQPASGRAMPWGDFARGRRVRAGEMVVGGRPC